LNFRKIFKPFEKFEKLGIIVSGPLASESGANGFDRTGRRPGRMCRIAVGLLNHPLLMITGNNQYRMAA
jgi:hypothetical protein